MDLSHARWGKYADYYYCGDSCCSREASYSRARARAHARPLTIETYEESSDSTRGPSVPRSILAGRFIASLDSSSHHSNLREPTLSIRRRRSSRSIASPGSAGGARSRKSTARWSRKPTARSRQSTARRGSRRHGGRGSRRHGRVSRRHGAEVDGSARKSTPRSRQSTARHASRRFGAEVDGTARKSMARRAEVDGTARESTVRRGSRWHGARKSTFWRGSQ